MAWADDPWAERHLQAADTSDQKLADDLWAEWHHDVWAEWRPQFTHNDDPLWRDDPWAKHKMSAEDPWIDEQQQTKHDEQPQTKHDDDDSDGWQMLRARLPGGGVTLGVTGMDDDDLDGAAY